MNYERTPDMGSSIYLNGCRCEGLWEEMQKGEAEKAQERDGVERAYNDAERETKNSSGREHKCRSQRDFEDWPLAMAYVPMQPWEEPFDLAKGLRAGTIFPSLRLPFRGGGC